ncbi:hypothetical protein BDN71DRAFT_95842 [Pleurotus eryngii]|uniref:F-box domain-containing protein n=1 Tax=Pleurotus eryngii TaxID=5323 RepID=A0A9P6DDC5_PLEER|nr:hypothetical protein BDN71DRAFT_95842 [Pleurotus eryngii]
MSLPVHSATDRVLGTAELLRLILENPFRDYQQTYRNALVSKTWSNEALNVLWYKLDSFLPLLKLLGPMSSIYDDVYGTTVFKYDRHVRPCDWDVFRRYSWRVRKIFHIECSFEVDDSVVFDLMATAPFSASALAPNLKEILYDGPGPLIKFIPLFMNESLECLGLYEIPNAGMTCRRVLSYIPHNAPNLRRLELEYEIAGMIHPEFDIILAALPHLTEVSLPPAQFVTSTLNALARLPHLANLEVTHSHGPKPLDVTATSLADTFPTLTTFTIHALSLDDIASLIETSKPRKLRSLDVSPCRDESRKTWCRIIAVITSSCPAIQEICIRHIGRHSWNVSETDPDQSIFSLPSLPHPCMTLTTLVFRHAPCLCLNAEIMRVLLSSLPSLETLDLSERIGPATLPLSALAELAPLCPHMKSLTLCVDTARLSISPPPETRFSCLKVFGVGISPLKSSALDVVSFLGVVLPKGCTLQMPDLNREEQAKWKTVADFLPMAWELYTAREGGC